MTTANAQQAYQYYLQQGYSPVQAAGIVGNLMQETGPNLDGSLIGDNGTAFGIAQWRGDRLNALKAFARSQGTDWNDFQTQLAFVNHELGGSERRAGDALRGATTVEDAVAAMIGFERPQGWTSDNPRGGHGWDNRLNFASALAETPAGAAPAGPATPNTPVAATAAAQPFTMPSETPESPLGQVLKGLGSAFGQATAPEAPAPRQKAPFLAADFADQSRMNLAGLQETLMPAPETLDTAPKPMSLRPVGQAQREQAAVNPLMGLFGAAKPAPLGAGRGR